MFQRRFLFFSKFPIDDFGRQWLADLEIQKLQPPKKSKTEDEGEEDDEAEDREAYVEEVEDEEGEEEESI